jgi:hypothetical protein
LLNFREIDTLEKIKKAMDDKYSEVLYKYDKELKTNKKIFEE